MKLERTQVIARRFGWATLIGGAAVITFWTLYLAGALSSGDGELVRRYEAAFLAADALLAAALLSASRALFGGRRAGPFLLAAGAAACLYLGLVDVAFYFQAGLYARLGAAAVTELLVNALCIGGGAVGLWGGWALWRAP